ncbi:MAG: MBL fold metallo-hydrolase, partial [Candidatus Poseidonia sp.]|nr:MBL fold metallo-hydrolase [Poseidonia sp.]
MPEDPLTSSGGTRGDTMSSASSVVTSEGTMYLRGFILFAVSFVLLLYRWNLEPIIYLLFTFIIFRVGLWLLSKTSLFTDESLPESTRSRKRGWQLSGLLIASFFIFILLGGVLFLNLSPQTGGAAESFDSPHFEDGTFQNMDSEETMTNDSFWGTLRNAMVSDSQRSPNSVLPTREYQPLELKDEEISITWLGHSTLLIQSLNHTIITDPLFGEEHTDPLFFGPTPFPYEHTYSPSQLPQIDYVFISHDHYDHLDMDTVEEL